MVQKAKTLTEIDLKKILETIRTRYGLDIPLHVTTADYDEEAATLFIRFSHDKIVEGEPTEDGLLLLHYSEREQLTAIEIIDIAKLA